MTREELTAWALANGWQLMAGGPSLAKPSAPREAIVRMAFKATVAAIEIKKPAGKWEKLESASYARITPHPDTGLPQNLGLETTPSIRKLMQDNKDRQVFARLTGPS